MVSKAFLNSLARSENFWICVGFYLRGGLSVVEINPRMAPIRTSVPPRFPATIPSIRRMIPQVSVETYLEPAMQTIPIII